MATYAPRPSPAELQQLRDLVRRLQARGGRDLLTREIVELTNQLGKRFPVTIDLAAAKDLGQPLIVMRTADTRRARAAMLAVLSRREREVAGLIAFGMRNREVADELRISLATVKDHVHHILQKTGLASRAALIAACANSR